MLAVVVGGANDTDVVFCTSVVLLLIVSLPAAAAEHPTSPNMHPEQSGHVLSTR